jgi:CheY-like chemotaxis protein
VSALRKDCLVAVAAEGSEGYHKALDLTPDVAVIDINMPGWDGLKTLQAFREHPVLSEVKVIMLTADASKQTVMAAIHGGANDYLIKTSFSKLDFYRKLNRLVPGTISHPTAAFGGHDDSAAAGASGESEAEKGHGAAARRPASLVGRGATGASSPAAVAAGGRNAGDESRLQEMIDGWE